ncbi:MAG TPA: hypothetical protein VKA37_10320, partial [Halobacteriales archaeon]|nr:hypothetical protein [Halobacteriales archaeon]
MPYKDWSDDARAYEQKLKKPSRSLFERFVAGFFGLSEEAPLDYDPPDEDKRRLEGLVRRNPARSLVVSARAAVLTRTQPSAADAIARRLAGNFAHVSGKAHGIVGRLKTDDELHDGLGSQPGTSIYEDISLRTSYGPTYQRYADRLRLRGIESRGIVVDVTELPCFTIIDGAGLTLNGRRAIDARPAEQTGLQLPPPAQLARYQGPGIPLCRPLTHDRLDYDGIVTVAPSLQPRHIVVCGATGQGKSVTLNTMALGNVYSTPGPTIVFDLKGDGMATEYCKSHYQTFGTLEDVHYFDLTETLPALSFFDIRSLLEAGLPRAEASSRIAGHYAEIVKGIMGEARFERAVVSPQVIATHIEALFDPIHGNDAFSHRDLQEALVHTQTQKAGPPVSDDDLANHFVRLVESDPRMFAQVMAGAGSRVEAIGLDKRLAPAFNHVPDKDDPSFDFGDVIDSDSVVVFDFGGMEASAKRTLTLVLLSALWRALKARDERRADVDHPVVNVFLDEAAAVADTELVDTLLSQGRSFGLSIAMGLQFPGQLKSADAETYYEALNETATFLVGRVAVDDDVEKVFATEALPASEVDRRLTNLGAGEWLVRLGAEFGDETPQPFLARSLPAPPGHAASATPLTASEQRAFATAFEAVSEDTARSFGLTHAETHAVDREDDEAEPTPVDHVNSLLPYTKRLPEFVDFDEARNALICTACGNRHNPDSAGMKRAILCCHSFEDLDVDDIPVSHSNLKLSLEERAAAPVSGRALHFLQANHDARQFRFDPLEYDMVYDSMLLLQEYVGIEQDEVDELIELGYLRDDGTHPHQLYTITPAGRELIGEPYRERLDYGDGQGDLDESSPHIVGGVVLARFFQQAFVDNPDSAADRVAPYHQ